MRNFLIAGAFSLLAMFSGDGVKHVQAATLDYTISGTASGTLNNVTFTSLPYLITLTADPARDIASFGYAPSVATIKVGGANALSFTSQVYFGETFDNRIYLAARNTNPFVSDFLGFSLPGYVDLSRSFGTVVGSSVVINQFVGVQTSGGPLTLTASSDVQFSAARTPAAVPGPIAGAGIPALLAIGGVIWARRRKVLAA